MARENRALIGLKPCLLRDRYDQDDPCIMLNVRFVKPYHLNLLVCSLLGNEKISRDYRSSRTLAALSVINVKALSLMQLIKQNAV